MTNQTKVVIALGAIAVGGYFFVMNQLKQSSKLNAIGRTGTMKTTDPTAACRKRCAGSESYNECMYRCTESTLNTQF